MGQVSTTCVWLLSEQCRPVHCRTTTWRHHASRATPLQMLSSSMSKLGLLTDITLYGLWKCFVHVFAQTLTVFCVHGIVVAASDGQLRWNPAELLRFYQCARMLDKRMPTYRFVPCHYAILALLLIGFLCTLLPVVNATPDTNNTRNDTGQVLRNRRQLYGDDYYGSYYGWSVFGFFSVNSRVEC